MKLVSLQFFFFYETNFLIRKNAGISVAHVSDRECCSHDTLKLSFLKISIALQILSENTTEICLKTEKYSVN